MADSPFKRKASNQEAGDFELPPAGNHPAYCVGLVDLGTHENEYHGEKKPDRRMLFIAWELCGTESNGGTPFVVGQDYTDSLGKKANWRKLIEAWRGKPFQPDEEFDPINLLGVKCMVNLSIGMTKEEKKFSDVTAVTMPPKGLPFPEQHYPIFAFHLSTWEETTVDLPIPEWMPRTYGKTLASVIKNSKEWASLEAKGKLIPAAKAKTNGAAPIKGAVGEAVSATQGRQVEPVDDLEEAPF